jgi:hypothetical protein
MDFARVLKPLALTKTGGGASSTTRIVTDERMLKPVAVRRRQVCARDGASLIPKSDADTGVGAVERGV